jgi:hypothetical protein
MKKSDFKEGYDFEALRYATELKVYLKDGVVWEVKVSDYWPIEDDRYPDFLDAWFRLEGSSASFRQRDVLLPSPEIERVEIVSRIEEENHGSHPEFGFSVPPLAELFKH